MTRNQPEINRTQGLGTNSFSLSHPYVLEREGRSRVAEQLLSILQHWFQRRHLHNLTVLDVGCSSGLITQYIGVYCGKTIGIDVDPHAIKIARKEYGAKPNVSFKLASGTNLPFKDRSFDIVICNQVYSYVVNPKRLMDEIYRVSKVGGICLFTGDNLLRPIEPLYSLPFLRLLPIGLTKWLLKTRGCKNIYVGNYKTYWGIKKLCSQFKIHDYTIKVLKEPLNFKYVKLTKYQGVLHIVPETILKIMEPFFPSFVFVLQKDKS